MKKILLIIFSFIAFSGFSQSLDSIKHIEIISEIQDSMALINKTDIDKINKTFFDLEISDSLNQVNDSIINTLTIINHNLDSIICAQEIIIENDSQIKSQIIYETNVEINKYKSELKKSNNKKIVWQSTTGLSLLAIILIILL